MLTVSLSACARRAPKTNEQQMTVALAFGSLTGAVHRDGHHRSSTRY
jgi:hypothetical protein